MTLQCFGIRQGPLQRKIILIRSFVKKKLGWSPSFRSSFPWAGKNRGTSFFFDFMWVCLSKNWGDYIQIALQQKFGLHLLHMKTDGFELAPLCSPESKVTTFIAKSGDVPLMRTGGSCNWPKISTTRWFKVAFLSPSWRSLNLWSGHLSIPKRSQRLLGRYEFGCKS